ncbi:MAG TPA: glycosyltransferase family 2 protein, partial [Chitinophagaceae bacterium]|nr:glycosyltransferase family 2 protein [Chitinophagaceae bacterium]
TISVEILVVNDGSSQSLTVKPIPGFTIHILTLTRNLGHQKAIAIGLSFIKEKMICDKVLVMDCDGEDRPEDATKLIQASLQKEDKIIFAQRKSRQEGKGFRFYYRIYKLAFHLLTGKKITFGNFMIMPRETLNKLVYYSEIWNHIPGGIMKSGLEYATIETHRGTRYDGISKMNFSSLMLHGFGAIAVFLDIIARRLLVVSIILIIFSILSILIIASIRSFTNLAIPGWASTLISSLLIVLLQSFLLSLFTIFTYITSQVQRKFIPANHYSDYTSSFETIHNG